MFSTLPPEADIRHARCDVRVVPISDIDHGWRLSQRGSQTESTPRLAPGRPQPPTMGFDNRAADREAQAHAVGLRRVEGFKKRRGRLSGRSPWPVSRTAT